MKELKIKAERKYKIVIDEGWLEDLQKLVLSEYPSSKFMFVIDSNVYDLYKDKLSTFLENKNSHLYLVKAGEHSKNINEYASILQSLSVNLFTRKDVVVAIGGGVVGDLAGFVASSYLRGISFIQIPTTILAMIDSSVGGKTAIDFNNKKNIVGAFYSPHLVCIDTQFINTLPEEEILCGYGELVKYAVLSKKIYKKAMANTSIIDLIKECILYKKNVVEQDFKEAGKRMLLNLGHTIGHAIEIETNFNIKHGAAVALGIIKEAQIASKLSYLKPKDHIKVKELLEVYNLYTDKEFDIANALKYDKKMISGQKINFVVICAIGKCKVINIDLEELIKLL